MYEYRATTIRILDADTAEFDIDLGLHVHAYRICRLRGINAPEMHGETLQAAIIAKKRLASLIEGRNLLVKTTLDRDDKYGRVLVEVWQEANPAHSVNHIMVAEGLAEPYMV